MLASNNFTTTPRVNDVCYAFCREDTRQTFAIKHTLSNGK